MRTHHHPFALILLLSATLAHTQIVDSFNPNPQTGGGSLNGFTFQPDMAVLAFGIFATFDGQPRPGLARCSTDGTLDPNFNPNASYPGGFLDINPVSVQTDHKLLVGGNFRSIGGRASTNLARLFPDGTADPSFNASADFPVMAKPGSVKPGSRGQLRRLSCGAPHVRLAVSPWRVRAG